MTDFIKLLKDEPSEVSFWLLDENGKYCGVNDDWFVTENAKAINNTAHKVNDAMHKTFDELIWNLMNSNGAIG